MPPLRRRSWGHPPLTRVKPQGCSELLQDLLSLRRREHGVLRQPLPERLGFVPTTILNWRALPLILPRHPIGSDLRLQDHRGRSLVPRPKPHQARCAHSRRPALPYGEALRSFVASTVPLFGRLAGSSSIARRSSERNNASVWNGACRGADCSSRLSLYALRRSYGANFNPRHGRRSSRLSEVVSFCAYRRSQSPRMRGVKNSAKFS